MAGIPCLGLTGYMIIAGAWYLWFLVGLLALGAASIGFYAWSIMDERSADGRLAFALTRMRCRCRTGRRPG